MSLGSFAPQPAAVPERSLEAPPEPVQGPAQQQPSPLVAGVQSDASGEMVQALPAIEFLAQTIPGLAPVLSELLKMLQARIPVTPEAAQAARQGSPQQFSSPIEAGVFLETKLKEIAAKRPELQQPIGLAVEKVRAGAASAISSRDKIPSLQPPDQALQEQSAQMLPA